MYPEGAYTLRTRYEQLTTVVTYHAHTLHWWDVVFHTRKYRTMKRMARMAQEAGDRLLAFYQRTAQAKYN